MKKRIIFDLDGTLVNGDFSKEIEYFKSTLNKDTFDKFVKCFFDLLMKYESMYIRDDIYELSKFYSENLKMNITPDFISGWIDTNCFMDDCLVENIKETLEYLKSKEKSLVVLTNWFYKSQVSRLKNNGLLEYFDYIYAGEYFLKPNKESYMLAKGEYDLEECIMIGDNIEKDVLGAKQVGMDSIYFNPNNNDYDKSKILSISNMRELKERF